MAEDSLISRAAAAIAEIMEAVERENDDLLGRTPGPHAVAGRKALAEIIARSLQGRGMLRDPEDKIPVYRGEL